MINYGLDESQEQAIAYSIATLMHHISLLEGARDHYLRLIASDTAKTLEHGLFYERNKRLADEKQEAINLTRQNIKVLQELIGVRNTSENAYV